MAEEAEKPALPEAIEAPETPEAFKWIPFAWHHARSSREALMKPAVWGAIALFAFLAYRYGSNESGELVKVKDERISFLNDQLGAYKDRLKGATPDEAAKQIREMQDKLDFDSKKLKLLLQDRLLSEAQIEVIIKACSQFENTKYDISFNEGDTEAYRFLEKIEGVLNKASWKEIDWVAGTFIHLRDGKPTVGSSFEQGVVVIYIRSASDTLSKPAVGLSNALQAADIKSRIEIEEDKRNEGALGLHLNKDIIHIMVGQKTI